MSKLLWDQTGERYYETGVDHGVLYPFSSNAYQKGVAWNGLTNVNEAPSGAEANPLWADNIKYLNLMSAEEFGATVEAYTYPDEFAECDGSAEMAPGVIITQQKRRTFGLCYRTKVGNDTEGTDYGYKLHLVYGALAQPTDKGYGTINDSPEAITFSWTLTTTPVNVPGFKPTAHMIIDSSKVNDPDKMLALENVLYGTNDTEPRLPMPDEIATIMGGGVPGSIEFNHHALNLDVGDTATLAATVTPAASTITWSSSNSEIASVADGVVTGEAQGNAIITGSITVDGVTFTDTCTVVVSPAE